MELIGNINEDSSQSKKKTTKGVERYKIKTPAGNVVTVISTPINQVEDKQIKEAHSFMYLTKADI